MGIIFNGKKIAGAILNGKRVNGKYNGVTMFNYNVNPPQPATSVPAVIDIEEVGESCTWNTDANFSYSEYFGNPVVLRIADDGIDYSNLQAWVLAGYGSNPTPGPWSTAVYVIDFEFDGMYYRADIPSISDEGYDGAMIIRISNADHSIVSSGYAYWREQK